jgi:hypothetical protein
VRIVKKVDILRLTPHRVKLRMPSPDLLANGGLRAVLSQLVGDSELEGLTALPDPHCAVLHLQSGEAQAKLLRTKQLAVPAPPNARQSPNAPSSPAKQTAGHKDKGEANKSKKGRNKKKCEAGEEEEAHPVANKAKSKGPAGQNQHQQQQQQPPKGKGQPKVQQGKGKAAAKEATYALLLHPIPVDVPLDELAKLFSQHTKAEVDFVTIRGRSAYVEVKTDPTLAAGKSFTIPGSSSKVCPSWSPF